MKAVLTREQYPESPRSMYENLGVMACTHHSYSLGDKEMIDCSESSWEDVDDYYRNVMEATTLLPLYLYDHSGMTISTTPFNCSWDSGRVGLIYITAAVMTANALTSEQATEILENEVDEYNNYLTGNVWVVHFSNGEGLYNIIGDKNDVKGYLTKDYGVLEWLDSPSQLEQADVQGCTHELLQEKPV